MTDFRITIYSGPGSNDSEGGYGPEVSCRVVGEREVANVLNQYGREWRTADYMGARQVVIVVDPIEVSSPAFEIGDRVTIKAVPELFGEERTGFVASIDHSERASGLGPYRVSDVLGNPDKARWSAWCHAHELTPREDS